MKQNRELQMNDNGELSKWQKKVVCGGHILW